MTCVSLITVCTLSLHFCLSASHIFSSLHESVCGASIKMTPSLRQSYRHFTASCRILSSSSLKMWNSHCRCLDRIAYTRLKLPAGSRHHLFACVVFSDHTDHPLFVSFIFLRTTSFMFHTSDPYVSRCISVITTAAVDVESYSSICHIFPNRVLVMTIRLSTSGRWLLPASNIE